MRCAVIAGLLISALWVVASAVTARAFDDIEIVVDESGVRIAEPRVESGESCVGPLSLATQHLMVTNTDDVQANVVLTASLDDGLLIVPDSCEVDSGVCTLMPGTPQVIWNVTIEPGATEFIRFTVRVGPTVPINTRTCLLIKFTVNGGVTYFVLSCVTTNSASQCGVGAPALGGIGRAALVVLLVLVGTLALRRRRTP